MLKRLNYILLMTLFLAIQMVAQAQYVIDKVCKNAVRTYRVDQGIGEPVKSYTWILKDALGNALSIPAGSPSGAGSEIGIKWNFDPGIYTLSVEKWTQFNCQVKELGTIEVIPVPLVDAGPDQTLCAGDLVNLSKVSTKDIPAGLEWTTDGDGIFSDASIEKPVYTPGANDLLTGKVVLKLTAKSLNTGDKKDGCLVSDDIEISIVPKPKLVITDPEQACEPDGVDLTLASVTEGSIAPLLAQYSYWNDLAATIKLDNPYRVIISGTYYIKLDVNGTCSDIQPVHVKVNPMPKLEIKDPDPVCEPATVDISSSYTTDPGMSVSYWADGLATIKLSNYTAINGAGNYYIKSTNPVTQCFNIQPVKVVINQRVVPRFDLRNELCQGSAPVTLPTTSVDGFKGSWNYTTVSTATKGKTTYLFTPDADQCALPYSIDINIVDHIHLKFDPLGPYCLGSTPTLPVSSNNSISGNWSPLVINTSTAGTFPFKFTPTAGSCAIDTTIFIRIIDRVTPTFDPIGTICQNAANPLPVKSKEGISGKWFPTFDPAIGRTYTFTPNPNECANQATLAIAIEPSVTTSFDPIGPFCMGDPAPTLPPKSKEGTSGTWSPAVVDMTNSGTYIFTPDKGICATSFAMPIVIDHLDVTGTVTPISKANPSGSIDLTVSGIVGSPTYSWIGPAGFVSSSEDISGIAEGEYNVVVTDSKASCPYKGRFTMYKLDELTAEISSTEITCPGGNNGTATVTISGGTPPYRIQWKNSPAPVTITSSIVSISGLSADPYFYATVFDATGKSVSSAFEAIQESSVRYTIDSFSSANPVCFGENGKIELIFGAGGIIPNDNNYVVEYDGGKFSGVEISGNRATISAPGGIYANLKVEVRGCPTNAVGPVTITPVPELILIAVVKKQPDCTVLTGTIEVTSPIGSYYQYSRDGGVSYQSSPIFMGLLPETSHSIRVKDLITGCESVVVSLKINKQPLNPEAPESKVIKNPTCNNPNGTFQIIKPLGNELQYSINGVDYQASPIFTNLKTNTYTIQVKNILTGCTSSGVISIPAIPPSPVITITDIVSPVCAGDSGLVRFTTTNTIDGIYTLNYGLGGEIKNVKVQGGRGAFKLLAGRYTNLTIESNDCRSDLGVDFTMSEPAAIDIIVDAIIEIDLKSQRKGAIDIHASGGTPFSVGSPYIFTWSDGSTTEDIKDLSAGTYTVVVQDSKSCSQLKKIIIPKPNYPPVAVDDQYNVGCNMIAGNVILNDTDPENDALFIYLKPVVAPLHGTLTLNVDGTFEYIVDPHFVGTDSFVYALFDKNNFPDITATVTLLIVPDTDRDGISDALDPDADGDGILNAADGLVDTDGDGYPNYLDIDSDNDGIVDNIEAQSSANYIAPLLRDTDGDGVDDAYDSNQNGKIIVPEDTDGDKVPDFLDGDSDGDGVPDYIEGHDLNADGKPDQVLIGKDSDGDGLDDSFDVVVNVCSPSENVIGSNAAIQDFDGDGKKDWRDDNDDDDQYLTRFEDLNMDKDFSNDDTDRDGHPEYLDYGRDCDLFIPDAFSPNNDNIHDYFQIYCIDHYPNAKIYIFDQLGNLLYQQLNYGNIEVWKTPERAWWDGRTKNKAAATSNGGMVAPGTYYYVLNLGNGEVKKSFVFISY